MPTRTGRKGAFRYRDARGRVIRDAATLERIDELVIPPAWKDVWISPRPGVKLQATGYDAAGRKQYLYHPAFRAAQDAEKYDSLILFGERLPALRAAMAEHLDRDELDRERVSAVALRLISLGWFRVGSERYAREGTYGVTTLLRRHVRVRGSRVHLSFRAKAGVRVKTELVDEELSEAIRGLLAVRPGARVFKYRWEGDLYNLTSKRLNDYVKLYLGEEFSAKDFRTWGGTLLAAIHFAERADRGGDPKKEVAAVVRLVAQKLGNTPAVCRASYVAPAVVEQYLDGRTIEDFRPRHLRVVKARDLDLSPEEAAMLSLLRSWRIRRAQKAA
jgi:DNA topoisomerase-1